METEEIQLSRRFSGVYSKGTGGGVCYAHATAKMYQRVIKVIFSPAFIEQTEKCDWLYNTMNNDDIYASDDTWENCRNEILSSLLFLLFFNTSKNSLHYVISSYNQLNEFLFAINNFYQKNLFDKVLELLLDKLEYKFLINSITPEQKMELDINIQKLACILITFIDFYKKKLLQINFVSLTHNTFDENKLINLTQRGFYAILSRNPTSNKNSHSLTIVDCIKDGDNIDLVIKHSHGKESRGFKGYDINVDNTGIIKNFKMTENTVIVFINPIFKKVLIMNT